MSGTQIGTSNVLATRIDNTSNYVSYLTYAASTPLHLSAEPKEQEDAEDVRVCIFLMLFFCISASAGGVEGARGCGGRESLHFLFFYFRIAGGTESKRMRRT